MKKSLRIHYVNIPLKALLILFIGLFIFKTSFSQTYVTGGIYSSTTWTTTGSPYIVVDTVVVFPGYTLTIQPGVVVKFENQAQIEIRQASLIALGTPADSIIFTSDSSTPTPGIYSGVFLDVNSLTCKFTYCGFRYANTGILTLADSLIIQNSNFNLNNTGVSISGGTALIDTCNFTNNDVNGLVGGTGTKTTNCNFSYNGTGLKSLYNNCTVTNCEFTYNTTGLYLDNIRLNNTYILHNQTGIISGGDVLKNCFIDSNTVRGISSNSDSIGNCQIEYNGEGILSTGSIIAGNTIEYNTAFNIDDNTSSNGSYIVGNTIDNSAIGIDNVVEYTTIILNTIENNSIGINLNNSNCTISCNKICNNTTYSVQYVTSSNFSIPNNYWCLPDSAAIQATIYDGYQNSSLGLLFFTPFDTIPCTSITPCSLTVFVTATHTLVCSGDTTMLTANISDINPVYTAVWNPGGYTGTTDTVMPLANATYTVVVTDSSGCTASASVTIDTSCITHTCNLTVTATATHTLACSGSPNTLTATIIDTVPVTSIVWTPGFYNGNPYGIITPYSDIIYTVTVTDRNGCTNSATVIIDTACAPIPCGGVSPPSICYGTVDTSSTFNTVYWQKTGMDTLAIDSVVIYRQNILSNYVPIGEVSVHAPTFYNDYTALPLVEPYFYALGIMDTCGGDTSLSNINETVFLQSSVGTGTNVVNLNWNFYQGNPVSYYRILRDDSGTGNWHAIDSVQGTINAFSDRSAPINPGLRYMLNVDWNVVCTPFLSAYRPGKHFVFNTNDEAYSNMTYLFPTGINNILDNNSINVYPNPVTDMVSISFSTSFEGIVKITDVLGQNVYSSNLSAENGSVKKINVNGFANGVYFIILESEGKFYRTKIIKM
jgi:Secretion system C-terminal sorting domain